MAGTFEIFTDRDSQFRFRLASDDGNVLAISGGYEQKVHAVTAITAVRENAAMAHITDLTDLRMLNPAEADDTARTKAGPDRLTRNPHPHPHPGTLRLVRGS
ncbi:DUF1508 domain-containing protein [Paenarthrobacter sp. DKR-5]|uniref:YegP family protein n=1 Tax=Paenarthrobacter sp. DKR-5 TaxID=2835535 RepID=UPI001BDBBD2A|nr:DUF1508 domain-containing protein [Paenarthrobacter sp. DKR-5]MBT1002008.1 DUF1508 domain-containing protein [Paenarthrobacter sp. DKR-5]